MPEGYTHLRTARRAAEALHITIEYPAAFAAGANGPDALFCYEIWKPAKKRRYDLPALGNRMHEEKTGLFLQNLAAGVTTRAQLEYTLGFFSHYAADTVLHPYVLAICQKGMPYGGAGGHGYFEIALDSTLHAADTGISQVPVADSSPPLSGAALAEVTTLLKGAIAATYGVDLPVECLADAFYHITLLRGWFTSRTGVRRAVYWLIEPLMGGRGKITGHVSPRRLKTNLPDTWQHPGTHQQAKGSAFALLQEAQKRSEVYMAALLGCRLGKLTPAQMAALLGSKSYTLGIDTPESAPGQPTQAGPEKEI
ncbi:MAG: zinc dependent phospholipase C family protein [Gemmiger sp.]|nr:zinc dependent phospholipase C family protein [Gemmiger sp.]